MSEKNFKEITKELFENLEIISKSHDYNTDLVSLYGAIFDEKNITYVGNFVSAMQISINTNNKLKLIIIPWVEKECSISNSSTNTDLLVSPKEIYLSDSKQSYSLNELHDRAGRIQKLKLVKIYSDVLERTKIILNDNNISPSKETVFIENFFK